MKQSIRSLILFLVFGIVTLTLSTNSTRAEATGTPVKIMTLNLHNGKDSNRQPNFERFTQLIATEQPDIISLQEVQAKHLKSLRMAGYQAIAGPNANYALFRFGNALLTRHKIVYHRHHYLPSQKEQRGVDEVLIDLNGRSLRILNTHLGLGRDEQKKQIDEITRICSYLPGPLIITGDFNLEPTSKLLTGFPWREVSADCGGYKTFPAKKPQAQIDQIWYSADLTLIQAQPLQWLGSDHLPVSASLILQTTTVLATQPPTIPDLTLQHNALLPDVGDYAVCLELSRFENTVADFATVTGSLAVPFAKRFSLNVGYDGDQSQFALTCYKTIDLRDYFSLSGMRGKAEWGVRAAINSNHEVWLEWSQYYRWSNRWGSKLVLTNRESQSRWVWEQSYLATEKIRLMFGADSDFQFRAGLAFTPDKRQIWQLQYRQIEDEAQYRLGWEYRFD
jgi:endonuclease/exonuclease/phosphatase family metal-dependent hydrolase